MQVKLTPQTNEELIKSVEAACPDFQYIPDAEKYVMALHTLGMTSTGISGITGKTVGGIDAVIDRYQNFTSQIPDSTKIRLTAKMMFNSLSSYAAVASDKKKISELSALDAIKCMKELKGMIPDLLSMEKEIMEHQNALRGMDGLGEFTKRLNDSKEEK